MEAVSKKGERGRKSVGRGYGGGGGVRRRGEGEVRGGGLKRGHKEWEYFHKKQECFLLSPFLLKTIFLLIPSCVPTTSISFELNPLHRF